MYNTPFYQIYAVYRYYVRFVKAKPEFKTIANDAYRENNHTKNFWFWWWVKPLERQITLWVDILKMIPIFIPKR